MKRAIEVELLRWKAQIGRKPLVLMGARQVGKTWLMRDFGRRHFAHVHEFNFDGNELLAELFVRSKQPKDLLPKLSAVSGRRIDLKNDLVIFDEIQECTEALNALKYFNEECPALAIMAAGSLLGVKLGNDRRRKEGKPKAFPVGKVSLMDVEPLDFGEFLAAKDAGLHEYWRSIGGCERLPEIMHQKLLDAYDEYLIAGGMPECVEAYLRGGDVSEVRRIQRDLAELYENDIIKHNGAVDAGKILVVLRSLVPQLAKDNAKFIYGVAKDGARAREYEAAIEWLVSARLVRRVYNLSEIGYPAKAYEMRSAFKLYHLDAGLLGAVAGVLPKSLALNEDFAFKGRLAENFVVQQLAGHTDVPANYWAERSEREIDFVLQHGGEMVPVEVKAGEDRKGSSFKGYVQAKRPRHAIRFSRRNLKKDGAFVNVPLYLAARYGACLGEGEVEVERMMNYE